MEIFLLVILIIILLLLLISYLMFYIVMVRHRPVKFSYDKKFGDYAGAMKQGEEWFRSQKTEKIEISAHDGTRLSALYLPAENSKGTLILFHGYLMNGYTDFSCAYRDFHEMGYSILNVFQRAHGESGGIYITFGVKERFDCRDWALYALDRFGPECDVFLAGISMGATTVLMSAGTGLPENVRGIIADCGFSCPYDEFIHVLKKHHVPVHPFVELGEVYARLFAGFHFKEYSTVEAMKNNYIPVLFIHGDKDELVPSKFSSESYDSCAGEKELLTVNGAWHGMSYPVDSAGCYEAAEKFLKKHSTFGITGGEKELAPFYGKTVPIESVENVEKLPRLDF